MTLAATTILAAIACAVAVTLTDSALRWIDAFKALPR